MDSITRYLLLILFVIIFLVMAPLIIMYITGAGLPFQDRAPSGTGILDVKSLPNNAEVRLNGERVGSTPTTTRFIRQGWHEVEVNAKGFRPWVKSLFIQAGQVTYAGSVNNVVHLLPESEPSLLAEQITAAAIAGNQLLYATTDNNVALYDLNNKAVDRSSTLTNRISELRASSTSNQFFALLDNNQWALLNTDTLALTGLPASLAASSYLESGNNNLVFGLNNNQLFVAGPNAPTAALLNDVRGFTVQGSLLYIATSDELATYIWTGRGLEKQLVLLSGNIPASDTITLYLTNQKELFLQANDSLYRVNQQLDLLNNGIRGVYLEAARQRLTFFTPTEIFYYNFDSARAELLGRTTNHLTGATVLSGIGYGFVTTDSYAEAVEIDNRGNQNRYQLFTGESVSQLLLSRDETQLIIFSSDKLYSVLIKK